MGKYVFKTQNIKGKPYVPVNERLIYFRFHAPEHKGWSLTTELLHFQPEYCIIRASIKNAEGFEVASGIGHETPTSGQVNRTSMVENCETSAVGRALGMLGIGIETSIASAEEVATAIAVQEAGTTLPDITADRIANMATLLREEKLSVSKAFAALGKYKISEAQWKYIAEQTSNYITQDKYKTWKDSK